MHDVFDTPGDRPIPDGGTAGEPCDDCRTSVSDALARTVEVRVDRSTVHSHRLCPDCFAEWIDRYEREMQPSRRGGGGSEIIVD
jgi:hypothetical protein